MSLNYQRPGQQAQRIPMPGFGSGPLTPDLSEGLSTEQLPSTGPTPNRSLMPLQSSRDFTPPGGLVQLSDLQTGIMPGARQPERLVIKGGMKRSVKEHHGHLLPRIRLYITLASVILMLIVTAGTLFATTPLGHDLGLSSALTAPNTWLGGSGNQFQNNVTNLGSQNNPTAIANRNSDGYSGYASVTCCNTNGLTGWAWGQCTYWANYRYHQLTGYWIPWSGDAWEWVQGAKLAGWNVSKTPPTDGTPSIIVLGKYTQGAYYYGHVAVVEKVVSSTQVYTSNYNWFANGGLGIRSYWYFNYPSTDDSVEFVWHP